MSEAPGGIQFPGLPWNDSVKCVPYVHFCDLLLYRTGWLVLMSWTFVFYLTEINYKNMTGSSQYKFGILAKIVKYLRVSVLFVMLIYVYMYGLKSMLFKRSS